jgi:transcriptional regulator with XRE-family HTH domain
MTSCPRDFLALPQDMTFGEHIRQWREERKLRLRQFAKAVGVSPIFISKMERGGPLPGEETIRRMAQILGQDPDALLALADKVAADVLAVIIKQPAYARFLRAHKHLTKDQLETLSKLVTHFG